MLPSLSCRTALFWLLYKSPQFDTDGKTQTDSTFKTNSGWQLFFLITLELRNKNKHKEHESAAHRVFRLTTYRVLFIHIYTVYIIESYLPLLQPLIVTQKYTNIPWVREKRAKREREELSTVVIYIRKPTGHSFLSVYTSARHQYSL